MATHFNTLLKSLPTWLLTEGTMGDIVIATLGRLVRNLPGHPFPGWSTEESRTAVVDALLPTLLKRPGFKTAFHADVSTLDLEQRRLLLERKLITPCMAARQKGCHIIIPRKQDMSIMLNEEEHLVAHFALSGNNIENMLTEMQSFAESLERDITFARSPKLGYVTSMPAESGEGMQFYVVLHLPALTMNDSAEQIERALKRLEFNIAPFYHGMQEDTGNTYILYTNPLNLMSLEDAILPEFEEVVNTLVQREMQLRNKMLEEATFDLTDRVGRAFGLLCYATKLSYQEVLDALSMMRLGIQCKLLTWEMPEKAVADKLTALSTLLAPTHIMLHNGRRAPEDYLTLLRSVYVKDTLLEAGPNLSYPYRSDVTAS